MLKKRKRTAKLLSVFLLLILLPFSALAASYSDTEGHWAATSIKKATTMHLAAGYEDGTFRPDGDVTRAEFIAFANRTFNVFNVFEAAKESPYSDVQPEDWFYEQILLAQAAGYLDIYAEGDMQPNTPINRQEASALLSRLLSTHEALYGTGTPADKEMVEAPAALPFTDQASIDDQCRPYVADLVARHFLAGYPDGSFRPQHSITRGEAITLLLRAAGRMGESANASEGTGKGEDGDKGPKAPVQWDREEANDGLSLVEGKYYLIGDEEAAPEGWIERNGRTYYAQKLDGLARGWKEIDGSLYYFSPRNCAMYAGGIKSTGQGAYWFADDGKLQTGLRPGGYRGKPILWYGPTEEELSNAFLKAEHADRIAKGQAIVNFSTRFEGIPFKWFGCDLKDPSGVYCCGATYSAYHEFGIAIPGPNDCDMYADNGYRMVKEQYLRAEAFGGHYVPADFSTMWPGDLSFSKSLASAYGFNHVALFAGMNGGRPVLAHATLADGFVLEPTKIITTGWAYAYLDQAVRYV